MEIAPGIHRVETPLGERINCLYVFDGPRHALLFDTGIDPAVRDHLVGYLDAAGIPREKVRWVVNSHCDWDHIGGNAAVRELLPGAVLLCGEEDRERIEDLPTLLSRRYGEFEDDHGHVEPDSDTEAFVRANVHLTPVDVGVRGGESLDLGDDWRLEVWHTPGHSWGHLSVYDPRSRAAVIGDAVLGTSVLLADGSPAFPPTYRYVDSYLATIHRLEQAGPSWLLTSHYPVYRDADAAGFLAASRDYVDRVDAGIRAALVASEQPRTMRSLIDELGPQLGPWAPEARPFLIHPFAGHLERFEQRRQVARDADGGHVAYRWVG